MCSKQERVMQLRWAEHRQGIGSGPPASPLVHLVLILGGGGGRGRMGLV